MDQILQEILELKDFSHNSVAKIYSKYYPYECNSIRPGTTWYDKVNNKSYTDVQMLHILFGKVLNIEKEPLIYTLKPRIKMLMNKTFQNGVLRGLKDLNYRP